MKPRIAVILCNLGGPASLEEVPQFLFNLFYDPAIFRLPNPWRWLLAKWVAKRRTHTARHIYAQMGGRSPILEETQAQAKVLEKTCIEQMPEQEVRTFVLMRYAAPRSDEVALQVKAFAPDHIVFLPLYPQYSTTTTASSLNDWKEAAASCGLHTPSSIISSYPVLAGFIEAHVELLKTAYKEIADKKPLVIFSAHGLPLSVIEKGDPYQEQIEQSCHAIVAQLAIPELDWQIAYQSRVGPMRWLEPSVETVLEEAGKAKKSVIVVPISFVSEHSETLVELDIEYREFAEKKGVPVYKRVPTIRIQPTFIKALADQVKQVVS